MFRGGRSFRVIGSLIKLEGFPGLSPANSRMGVHQQIAGNGWAADLRDNAGLVYSVFEFQGLRPGLCYAPKNHTIMLAQDWSGTDNLQTG